MEQDQEGERKRTEKETQETQREGFVQWQEQVAVPREKGGASFHLLIGDLNWLQIGFSLRIPPFVEYGSLL